MTGDPETSDYMELTQSVSSAFFPKEIALLRRANTELGIEKGDCVIIGGMAARAILPYKMLRFMTNSGEVDLAVSNDYIKERNMDIVYNNLVDKEERSEEFGSLAIPSPFLAFGYDSEIDIFPVEQVGIGPIPYSERMFEGTVNVSIDELRIRVANPSLILAYSLNPLSIREDRIKKAVMSAIYVSDGREQFRSEFVEQGVAYLQESKRRVAETVNRIRSEKEVNPALRYNVLNNENYRHYDEKLSSTVPNRIGQLEKKIVKIMRRGGIDNGETEAYVEIIMEALRRA